MNSTSKKTTYDTLSGLFLPWGIPTDEVVGELQIQGYQIDLEQQRQVLPAPVGLIPAPYSHTVEGVNPPTIRIVTICDRYSQAQNYVPPRFHGFQSDDDDVSPSHIPFVNRHVEVFDAMAIALSTAEGFVPSGLKKRVPLASQTLGVGKTFLGRNLIRALNRPKEGQKLEKEVAARLRLSNEFRGKSTEGVDKIIQSAIDMKDHADESLVTRTLRVFLKSSLYYNGRVDELVDIAKQCKIVVIDFEKGLPTLKYSSCFRDILIAMIVKAAAGEEGLRRVEALCEESLVGLNPREIMDILVSWYGPLLILLEEITVLGGAQLAGVFGVPDTASAETRFQVAMDQLSLAIKGILSSKNVFVYCTGRSSYVMTSSPPLFSHPVIIHPLRESDVELILAHFQLGWPQFVPETEPLWSTGQELAAAGSHEKLLRKSGEKNERNSGSSIVDENLVSGAGERGESIHQYFVSELVRLSGGNGRIIELVLSPTVISEINRWRSKSEVDAALAVARKGLENDSLVPLEARTDSRQLEPFLHLIAEYLIFDKTFDIEKTVIINENKSNERKVPFCNILTSFGMSYTMAEERAGEKEAAAGKGAAASKTAAVSALRIVVGSWQLSLLREYFTSKTSQKVLRILESMKAFPAGTNRGGPFERLCFHSMQSVLATANDFSRLPSSCTLTLGSILPHFKGTSVETIEIKRGHSPPPLEFLSSRLSGDQLADTLLKLADWTLVNPMSESPSQDWFLCVPGAVIGFVNKAYSGDNLVRWKHIKEELVIGFSDVYKANGIKYLLVVYATQYGPNVCKALGTKGSPSIVCKPGVYQFTPAKGIITQTESSSSDSRSPPTIFEVFENQELVIVNPTLAVKGGLNALLGEQILNEVLTMSRAGSDWDFSFSVDAREVGREGK